MSIAIQQHEIENFFDRYEARINDALSGTEPEIDEAVRAFASDFIEASPTGIFPAKNNKKFRKAISQGWSFYKEIGIRVMDIVSLQITILDNLHAIVKVHWNCSFVRKNKTHGDISFDVFYLLQKAGDDLKIFAYITGDEQQGLKDAGLVGS